MTLWCFCTICRYRSLKPRRNQALPRFFSKKPGGTCPTMYTYKGKSCTECKAHVSHWLAVTAQRREPEQDELPGWEKPSTKFTDFFQYHFICSRGVGQRFLQPLELPRRILLTSCLIVLVIVQIGVEDNHSPPCP